MPKKDDKARGTRHAAGRKRSGAGRTRPRRAVVPHGAQRLDIRLALGSITEADAQAYVLGMFPNVVPSGPARAIDARLGGAIADFTARRMFAANAGELFVLPTGRHPVRADMIVFVGLGPFDRFNDQLQQLAAENMVRLLARTAIDDFATVLIGSGSGRGVAGSLTNLVSGFLRGLRDADRDRRVRRITICETNRVRYREIRREIARLARTPLVEGFDIDLEEVRLPEPAAAPAVARALAEREDPVYLIVRQTDAGRGKLEIQSALLTAGAKATVISDRVQRGGRELDELLEELASPALDCAALEDFGGRLAPLVLGARVLDALAHLGDRHLVLVHDAPASRMPWETLRVAGRAPALDKGLSRRYAAENLSVAKWLAERQRQPVLSVLLVVNPTGDLPGAEQEGDRVRRWFAGSATITLRELRGAAATRDVLREAFSSGQYDVIHYAGHAFFDPADPAQSGVVCHGGLALTGADLAGLGNLPSLVFFNACEAGRVRAPHAAEPPHGMRKRIERSAGLAEAFLRGGVANYVGTYWPVGDASAKCFAETFYAGLMAGKPIGQALCDGRTRVRDLDSVDWADYIHYGSHGFVLKET